MRSVIMVLAIAAAAVAVLASVVVLALGKGGELAEAHPDHPPLPLPADRPLIGTDIALLRLPRGLWGYHVSVTDEALRRMAYALSERDVRITRLQEQLAEVQKALGTAEPEPDAPWFAPVSEYDAEPAPWAAPAEFGHAADSAPQFHGPPPLFDESSYGGRHEARGDTVAPEDR